MSSSAESIDSRGDYRLINVRPLTGRLGAELHGVDLSQRLDESLLGEIKQAFLDWVENNPDELPMSKADLDEYLKDRTW